MPKTGLPRRPTAIPSLEADELTGAARHWSFGLGLEGRRPQKPDRAEEEEKKNTPKNSTTLRR